MTKNLETETEVAMMKIMAAEYVDPDCAERRLREGTMPAIRAAKVMSALIRAYQYGRDSVTDED